MGILPKKADNRNLNHRIQEPEFRSQKENIILNSGS